MPLPRRFQFRFHPVGPRRPGLGVPSVGIPDPRHQVSQRPRAPLEAPAFRRPGLSLRSCSRGRERRPRSLRVGGPRACRAHGLCWAPGMAGRPAVVGAGIPDPGPETRLPAGRSDHVVGNGPAEPASGSVPGEVPQGTPTLAWGFGGKADPEPRARLRAFSRAAGNRRASSGPGGCARPPGIEN